MVDVLSARCVRERASDFYRGLTAGDVDLALSGFREDASYWGITFVDGRIERKLYRSRAEIRAYLAPWCTANRSDGFQSDGATYSLDRAEEHGDCMLTEYSDVARKGGVSYENRGIILFEFDADGHIAHARAYQDMRPILDFVAGEQPVDK